MNDGAAEARGSKRVDLALVSVPRLMFALLHQRFTGTWTVEQTGTDPGPRRVWFRGGMPVYTEWASPPDVLGQVLLAHRLIDEDQLLQALESMAEHGGLLGQHLTALRVLDRPRLLEGLRQQLTRKLVRMFALRSGTSTVTLGPATDVDADLIPANVLGLVLAGVGHAYDEARVESEMGPALQGVVTATGALARYRPHFHFRPADEPAVEAMVRGVRPAQLAMIPGVTPRRAWQLVYTLWACQMLRTAIPAAARPQASVAPPAAPPPRGPVPRFTGGAPSTAPPVRQDASRPRPRATTLPEIDVQEIEKGPTRSPTSSPGPAATPGRRPRATTLSDEDLAQATEAAMDAISKPAVPPSPSPPAVTETSPPHMVGATPSQKARTRTKTLPDLSPPPPTTATTDDDEGDDPFLTELVAMEDRLEQGAHAFELLGVPLSATKRDVRRAWGDLSRKFHPDALQSQGRAHLRERVNDVFAALSEAMQVLGDADKREQLRSAIEKGEHVTSTEGKDATAHARAVFQSEVIAKEGDKLLRANKFDRALERFREAATYNPDEPDLQAAIAWCEYQTSPKGQDDATRARTQLSLVIEQSPRLARAHYFLGFVLTDLRSPTAAIESFGKAAKLDPRNIDAERQARALKARQGQPMSTPPKKGAASKDKKSGLRGLFGKK